MFLSHNLRKSKVKSNIIKLNMPLKTLMIAFIFLLLVLFPNHALCLEDINLSVRNKPSRLEVEVQIIPSSSFLNEYKEGLNKNLFILVDLYRRWSIIPDEFIWGVQIKREFFSNPIKEEFIVKSQEGQTVVEKRFKSWQEAIDWGLKLAAISIDTQNLEKGKYYIRVTVESNIKKIPTILEHFLFFIPKHEKKIQKESEILRLP